MTSSALAALESEDAYVAYLAKQPGGDLTDVIDDVRKSGSSVVTYPWEDFLKFKMRSEKPAMFQKRATRLCEKHGYLIMFGRTTVVVCWDSNFAPPEDK